MLSLIRLLELLEGGILIGKSMYPLFQFPKSVVVGVFSMERQTRTYVFSSGLHILLKVSVKMIGQGVWGVHD